MNRKIGRVAPLTVAHKYEPLKNRLGRFARSLSARVRAVGLMARDSPIFNKGC